ncbi:hypothetical protein [Saccharothrix obliqua]|uniref:hypothetical protein n=1 Tax=Saccharothrix obliqua TaxID=2861747 RepID=UPI001C5DB7E3|nr:hypothetical protein [Saccharothrix obliqua]MBW4720819.1 hypothetical protein [Saccharothrix obliqua]
MSVDFVDGQRVVRVRHNTVDRGVVVIEQRFPDALQHLYVDRSPNGQVALYSGSFVLNDEDDEGDYIGVVRFNWLPTVRAEALGESRIDLRSLSGLMGGGGARWSTLATVSLPYTTVPEPPEACEFEWSNTSGSRFVHTRLGDQSVGDEGTSLDRVTFFVPNGWAQGFCSINIRDYQEPWIWWRGRVEVDLDEWVVSIDLRREMGGKAGWDELRASGGSRFTHVGELRRKDGRTFAYADVTDLLHQLGLAMSLTLGRWVRPLLPVGWAGEVPVWSSWRVQPIDRMISVHTWSDRTEFPSQLAEVARRVVEFCRDGQQAEILQYAVSYYVTINTNTSAELSTAIPISGLQMLAYDLFIERKAVYSRSRWSKLHTEEEIRLLLEDCGIDLGIPSHMAHLKDVATALGPTDDGRPRDALRCLVDMRNLVVHPTRDKPIKWRFEQWVEASILACHYLELAILRVIGFEGKTRSPLKPSIAEGAVYQVPWV